MVMMIWQAVFLQSVSGTKMKNVKVVSLLEQDDVKEKLNWLHKWYQDGIINPDANVVTDGGKQSIFGSAQGWPAAATTWAFNNGIDKYDLTQVFGRCMRPAPSRAP